MVFLRKLIENNDFIKYEYIPENKIENGKGEITVNKLNLTVKKYSLSKLESETDILGYRNKAFLAIKKFNNENKYPNEYLYAWY